MTTTMTSAEHMLAAFVTPWLFYAGTGAVSIPIIIHLLAKRRYQRIRWAAIDFLLLAEKQNRRKINLQELILLALRCLAVLLLGLLLARPYLKSSAFLEPLGLGTTTERIFVLDDSFSMSYTTGTKSTFDRAKENSVKLLQWIHKELPHDRVTIIRTSDPLTPLVSRVVLDQSQLQMIRDRLQALAPSHTTARVGDVLAQLHDALIRETQQLNTAIYVVSDFQKHDWISGDDPLSPAAGSPLDSFADWPHDDKSLTIVLVQVADELRDNLAITRLATGQPQLVATINNRLVVTISNFSSKTSSPFDLNVFLEDAAQPAAAVPAIPPGQAANVVLNITFPTEGYQDVRVEIPGDAVSIDNQRSGAYDVQPAIKVLLINGEPSSSTIQDEVALLATALRPEGEVFSGFHVITIDESEIDTVNFTGFHIAVFANVYRVPDDLVVRLEEFVFDGGGLAFFMGDQVEPTLYNQRLWKDGEGLLPCELGQVVQVPPSQKAPTLFSSDWTHPLISVYGGEENPFLSGLAFWQYVDCVVPTPQVSGAGESKAGINVVAVFDDPERHPAIIVKSFGWGKIILFASSCDLEWNNWAKSPGYVVTLLQLGQYLAKPSRSISDIVAGEVLQVGFDVGTYQPRASLRTPSYPSEPEFTIEGVPSADGGSFELLWPETSSVGVYQLLMVNTSGAEEEMLLAVNPDPSESDLRSCTETELRGSAPKVNFDYITDVAAITGMASGGERELWPALLIAVVLVLMLEQTLACWFGR